MNALPAIQPATFAVATYERMVAAIAECERYDEAKDIRDKAVALEAYFRQAKNLDAERQAANVRLRAERRAGELMKELARAEPEVSGKAGRDKQLGLSTAGTAPSPYAETLARTGTTRQEAHRFQQLAAVPEEQFEAALRGPDKPTRKAILDAAKPKGSEPPPMSEQALWLWGRLRDFEREGMLDADLPSLVAEMTPTMQSDVRRLVSPVIAALSTLEVTE